MSFYYRANEMQDKAKEKLGPSDNSPAIYEQKIRSMFAAGEYWYVEKFYKEAVEMGIVNAYMTSYYGDALMNCKQYDKAMETFRQVIDLYANGDPMYTANYLYAIGDCLKNLGRTQEAGATYEEAYSLGGNIEKYKQKMMALELVWEINDAQSIVSGYMEGMTNEEIADTLADYGYYEEALGFYEKAESEGGLDMRTSIAYTYNSMGLPKEAAALYEAYIAENPEDSAALNMLGAIYCDNLGRYAEAEELFNKVVELNPRANATMGNLAVVARKSGSYDKLPELYEKVRQTDDTYIAAYHNKIKYQKDITVEAAMQELSNYPGWPETEEMQALMLRNTIDTYYMTETTLNSYLEYFMNCLEKDGSNYYYLSTVASLLCGLGEYEEAHSYYVQAKNVAGVLTYYATNGLGNCYYYLQDYDSAAEQYEKNFTEASDRGSILNAAECYIASGQYDRVNAQIERYVSEGGLDDVSYYYMLLAYQEEEYEVLLDNAEQYLESNPNSLKAKAYKVVAMTELGMEGSDEVLADIDSIQYTLEDKDVLIAESILGRFDKARECYQLLLQYYPRTAREVLNDYELRNVLQDPAFCSMAGLEAPVIEEVESEDSGEVIRAESTEEIGIEENVEESPEANSESAEKNYIPVVVSAGILITLLGTVAVLVRMRNKTK